MELLIIFRGSDVLALIEVAREQDYDYQTFYEQMKIYQKWNKGKGYDDIIRKIYIKYVYKSSTEANDTDILYSNVLDMIENSNSEMDLREAESIVETLREEKQITESEYNYFINLIGEKREQIS